MEEDTLRLEAVPALQHAVEIRSAVYVVARDRM